MSTTAPSQPVHDPTLNSGQSGPNQPDNLSSTINLPPDPLLDSGSFIDANPSASTTTNYQTLNRREPIREQQAAAPATSNGAAESVTTPEKSPQRRSAASRLPEAFSWLPPGWIVEDRVRNSGATAGTVDKYYFDPVSGRRFRSKKEVLYFLETGTARKRKKDHNGADVESLGSSGSSKQKKPGTKRKASALNFDYFNAPEKIKWVLTDNSESSWTPFIGKEKVPETVKQNWDAASATTNKGRQATF